MTSFLDIQGVSVRSSGQVNTRDHTAVLKRQLLLQLDVLLKRLRRALGLSAVEMARPAIALKKCIVLADAMNTTSR